MTEMTKLINILVKKHIPFEVVEDNFFDTITPHIYYPSYYEYKCSVVCHQFSYGGKCGKLEISGLSEYFDHSDDGVVGWLDAEEVARAIALNYCKDIISF